MLERTDSAGKKRWRLRPELCIYLLFTNLLMFSVYAEAGFKIESATIYESANNYYLNASIDYDMHPEAYEILAKGLPIRISFELEIYQPRRYWLDRTLLEKKFNYRLQHDPITDQYELTRKDTDFGLTYETAEQAIDSLHYLSNLFIVETTRIPAAKLAQVQLRMSLDVRNFPDPMQYLSQYWGDWVRTTDWYHWALLAAQENTLTENPESDASTDEVPDPLVDQEPETENDGEGQ